MKKAFFKSFVLLGTLFLCSCVVMRDDSSSGTVVEKSCFYDASGIYRCKVCTSNCRCEISSANLCTFDTWENACKACNDPHFLAGLRQTNDLFLGCSKTSVCSLCEAGFDICNYPRTEWRFEYRPGPPPPPRKDPPPPPRRHRGRPDDIPGT